MELESWLKLLHETQALFENAQEEANALKEKVSEEQWRGRQSTMMTIWICLHL
jgi:hypothetical protein